MKINTIDLFAGCGGLSDGFFKTNFFDMVCVVDWNKKCCDTQIHNISHKFGKEGAKKRVINFFRQEVTIFVTIFIYAGSEFFYVHFCS